MCANPRMRTEMLRTLADEAEFAPWRRSSRPKRRPVGRRAVMASLAIIAIPALAIALFVVAAT